MKIKTYEKALKNFTISEAAQLRMRAKAADNLLGNLPGESEWKSLNPKGPSLQEKRKSLIEARDEALAALKQQPPDLGAELTHRKFAAMGLPASEADKSVPGKRSKPWGIGALFADGPCPEKTSETLYLEPENVYKQMSDEGESWYFQMTERSEDMSAVFFRFNLGDTNNDPWNSDYMEGWLRIFWIYDLPQWSYDANYQLGIYGRLNIQAEMYSNNFLGRRWWGSYYAGGMAADNELVQLNDSFQPIYHTQGWTGDPASFDSGQVYLTKNQFMEAGESRQIFLYYWMYLFADRGTVETIGSVHAYESFNNFPLRPRLRCVINPV